MTSPSDLTVPGRPTGARAWRRDVAEHAAAAPAAPASGIVLGFTLPPAAWVDVDTLAENTLAALRDAGALAPRFAGLDAIIATKTVGSSPGATVAFAQAEALQRRRPPGVVACDVTWDRTPRAGDRAQKAAWRARIAEHWADRPILTGAVWADVALGVAGSLLGPVEVVVDALEPVLGRDPRGRDWQEFFPNDHHIVWLRVRRVRTPALHLRLGPIT